MSPAPESATPPLTTLTVFTFSGRARLWALGQMALARPLLWRVPGLRFHQLMGAGQGLGFTLAPDWGRYAFLGVWASEGAARRFLTASPFMRRYRRHADRAATVLLQTLSARGAWQGVNPFLPAVPPPAERDLPIAVLTRATIRFTRLRAFWSEVPASSAAVGAAPGRIASIGIGEAPFLRQATFSLWENAAAVRAFAYRTPDHQRAIARTRQEDWYREELFARFAVLERSDQFP